MKDKGKMRKKELRKLHNDLRKKTIKRFNQLGITLDWPNDSWNPLRMHLKYLDEKFKEIKRINDLKKEDK